MNFGSGYTVTINAAETSPDLRGVASAVTNFDGSLVYHNASEDLTFRNGIFNINNDNIGNLTTSEVRMWSSADNLVLNLARIFHEKRHHSPLFT